MIVLYIQSQDNRYAELKETVRKNKNREIFEKKDSVNI